MRTVQIIIELVVLAILLFLVFFFQELTPSSYIQQILPSWPFILVICLSLSPRFHFGIALAFFVGLLQDVFLEYPLFGLHACIYSCAAFLMMSMRDFFNHSSMFSQSLIIGLLTLLKIIIVLIFQFVFYAPTINYVVFISVLLTAFVWPWIYVLFEKIITMIYHE